MSRNNNFSDVMRTIRQVKNSTDYKVKDQKLHKKNENIKKVRVPLPSMMKKNGNNMAQNMFPELTSNKIVPRPRVPRYKSGKLNNNIKNSMF